MNIYKYIMICGIKLCVRLIYNVVNKIYLRLVPAQNDWHQPESYSVAKEIRNVPSDTPGSHVYYNG